MAWYNTCQVLGPYNTPINNGTLTFTQEVHGFDYELDWDSYFADTSATINGTPHHLVVTADGIKPFTSHSGGICAGERASGWTLTRVDHRISNNGNPETYFGFPFLNLYDLDEPPPYDKRPNHIAWVHQTHNQNRFEYFDAFNYLNSEYNYMMEPDGPTMSVSQFLTSIDNPNHYFLNTLNMDHEIYYWVKVQCEGSLTCQWNLQYNNNDYESVKCNCIRDFSDPEYNGEIQFGTAECDDVNEPESDQCLLPAIFPNWPNTNVIDDQYKTSMGMVDFGGTPNKMMCTTLSTGGIYSHEWLEQYNEARNLDVLDGYVRDNIDKIGAGYGTAPVIYTNEIHPAFNYNFGCPGQDHPSYNSNFCIYNDDSSYLTDNNVCQTYDCAGSLIIGDTGCYVNGGCSIVDQCGQCILSQFSIDDIDNGGPYITENPDVPPEGVYPVYYDGSLADGYERAENCLKDKNNDYCLENVLDDCNECNGNNQLDVGCGCERLGPTWFFLDSDIDCNTDEYGYVQNAGGSSDEDCDITPMSLKLMCRSMGTITINTCDFSDYSPGSDECRWTKFNPVNYVDCNLPSYFTIPDNLDPSLFPDFYFNDGQIGGSNLHGSCFFDWDELYDTGTSTAQLQGCTDPNATNYNPEATFGFLPDECVYPNEVGDLILTLDYGEFGIHEPGVDSIEVEIYYWIDGQMLSTLMTWNASQLRHVTLIPEIQLGSSLKYTYKLISATGEELDDGIIREILIQDKIPTYAPVDYFNKYTNQFLSNKTNLPILNFTDGSVILYKDEIDEMIYLDNSYIQANQVIDNLEFPDTFKFYKEDIKFTTTNPNFFDVIGMDEDNGWYVDTLSGDKTKIKAALGFYIWDNMNDHYSYDNRFVDLAVEDSYRGTSIVRKSIPTPDEFDHTLYFFDETDGESYDLDGNVLDETIQADIVPNSSFIDLYILAEVMGNLDSIKNAVVYHDENVLHALAPTTFNNSLDTDQLPNVPYPFPGSYCPIDYLDLSHDGWIIQYLIEELFSAETHKIYNKLIGYFMNHKDIILERYNELRGGILNIDTLMKRIDYYYDYLKHTIKSDNKRWRYFDYENFETYKDIIDNTKDWLTKRIKWLDVNWRNTGGGYDISYCNNPLANNYLPSSNFNDGTCNYYSDNYIIFEIDMVNINHPPIERVELEIIKKTMYTGNNVGSEIASVEFKNILQRFEMTNIRNDVWEIKLPVTDITDDFSGFLHFGDKIEYHFIKHIPQVYNVETGAIEEDKSRFHLIDYKKETILSHYFNDFVDNLIQTNLPIIKINTTDYNDFGPIGEDNKNLFYCPTYLLPNGYLADGPSEEICDSMKNDIDYFKENGSQRVNFEKGYFDNKTLCEQQTLCETDCIDGTNPQDEPKVAGFIDIIYNGENSTHTVDDKPQISTKIGVEIRGFSSRGFPKKQYAVELQEIKPFAQCDDDSANYNVFCNGFNPEEGEEYNEDCIFPIENDFVLLGPYRDRVYVRNAFTYEVSGDMGNPSSNSKHVEFYLNGVYQGLFVVFEKPKIDENRMDVGDAEISCSEIKIKELGVHITEVMFESGGDYDTGDYIKIQNSNTNVVNITGWKVDGWGGEFQIPTEYQTELTAGSFIVFIKDVEDFNNVGFDPSIQECSDSYPTDCYYEWGSGGLGDSESARLINTTDPENPLVIDNINLGVLNSSGDCISGADGTGNSLQITNAQCPTTTCGNFRNDVPTFVNGGATVIPGEGDDPNTTCIMEGIGESYTYQDLVYDCYGGYIVKIESGGEQDFFIMDDGFSKVEYYDPKFATLTEVEAEYIRDKVISAQYDTIGKFDTDSFVDYVITQELAKNNEGYTRSQYWYVKDDNPDKFHMGYVWDFNHSYGAVKSDVENWAFKEFFAVGAVWSGWGQQVFGDLAEEFAFLNQPEIIEKFYERWVLHRQGALDTNNLLNRIDDVSAEIQKFDALARDDNRWFYSNNQDYEVDYSYFKTWLLSRLTWMDKYIPLNIEAAGEMWANTNTLSGGYWNTMMESYSQLFNNDTYNKTFIVITLPENNKIYDLNDTKFIKFNWITSLDLHIIKGRDLVNGNLYGDYFLSFDIVNKITGNTLHTFSSNEFWGKDKASFPEYIWNISDIDNIEGSYYIRASYTYYEAITGPIERECTFDEVYSEFLCDENTDGQVGLDGTECTSDLYGEYIHDGGLEGCLQEGDIIETIDYITSVPRNVYSNPVDFSIQSQSQLQGCTDTFAINYDVSAQFDDGSCKYQEDCDQKYIISRTDVDGLRTFYVSNGYNILSYPFPFATENIDFFDVLNASYFPNDGGTFSEYDGITAHFEGNSYSAVFIDGNWKSTNTMGFDINNIKPGMGIVLELQKPGYITWSIPQSERFE